MLGGLFGLGSAMPSTGGPSGRPYTWTWNNAQPAYTSPPAPVAPAAAPWTPATSQAPVAAPIAQPEALPQTPLTGGPAMAPVSPLITQALMAPTGSGIGGMQPIQPQQPYGGPFDNRRM